MQPDLKALIQDLTNKLQLDPWTDTGQLQNAAVLTLIARIANTASTTIATAFRWRDCEPLIEQANALLDRALLDRNLFQAAGEKFATFTLDVRRSIRLIEITDQEKADKRFETPYLVSKSQCESQKASRDSLTHQVDDPKADRSVAVSSYTNDLEVNANRNGYLQYISQSGVDGSIRRAFNYQVGPYPSTMPAGDMALDIAKSVDRSDRNVRASEMRAEIDKLRGQRDSLVKSIEGSQAQQEWDDKNRKHLQARADVEKEILSLKLSMAKIEWLLDFRQQMNSIAPRYCQTVRDAYDRLLSVQEGLAKVFGRSNPDQIPSLPKPPDEEQWEETTVDRLVSWTRQAGTWFAALTRRSHNYVLPISIRAVTGSGWKDGMKNQTWHFSIGQSNFNGQCYIRVRGIAGWVVGGDRGALWTLDVQLPNQATFIYEDGGTNELDQGLINCRISAVTSRSEKPTSDVVGLTSCYNASPIGQDWVVKINNAFGLPSPSLPDDIQLDLYLSVVPL